MKIFFDDYCNVLPTAEQETSENPSTFNAAYYFSQVANGENTIAAANWIDARVKAKYLTNGNTWRTMEHDPNPDFSLDEKISVCAVLTYHRDPFIRKVPLFTKDISHYRPDVFLYVLGSKYRWLRFLCWPVVWYKLTVSMKEFKADPVNESSGAQLAFIKLMGWRKTYLLEDYWHLWPSVFKNYYIPEDHPIHRFWK